VTPSLARSGELRRLLRELIGGGDWRLRSMTLGRGDRDKVIAERDGQRYFVKLMWPPGAAATRAAAEVGLAPPVIATGRLVDSRAVVVQQFVTGSSGAEPRVREWMLSHASDLADLFASLARRADLSASLPTRQSESPRERAEVRLRDMQVVANEVQSSGWAELDRAEKMLRRMRVLSDALPDVPHPLVPVHGDPQWANWLLTTAGQLYLVDWDHARLDDPVTDPARLAWWLYEPGPQRRHFIERCGLNVVEDTLLWQRAEWSVTAYVGHTALWVARQGRLARASQFLDWCDQLLNDGL
jgi:aminoglycoside phosphotransferase (APT) family kinase protein